MAKIVITKDRGVWRVSRRVMGARRPAGPGLVLARSVVSAVMFPLLLVLNLVGVRPWQVEARTVDGPPVVWYVRGTRRARRVAREVISTLIDGRPFDDVMTTMSKRT